MLANLLANRHLKQNHDLRRIVEQDLGPAAARSGRAWLWKCPFHHERKGFSLAVWVDGYRCFGRCAVSGDLFDWLRDYRRLSFPDALAAVGTLDGTRVSPSETAWSFAPGSEPPPALWQQAAQLVVEHAETMLWSSAGEGALHYLLQRGLNTGTIRQARLGYIPGDSRAWRTLHGLEVACGITIPWFACEALWAVKIRRAASTMKYVQIAGGSSGGLYLADRLANMDAALCCEGEFDALLVQQEAGKLVAPVTLGSAVTPLSARWYGELSGCVRVLVAYDNDEAGKRGAERLLRLSPRFQPVTVPEGKDITEFYLRGGDVYGWLAGVLQSPPPGEAEVQL